MDGLYFYKLVSPYQEDVTKDCKLTVNEIDHNFVTLKDADIKDVSFNSSNYTITLKKNNGDELSTSLANVLSGMTSDLSVSYEKEKGVITVTYNDETIVIDGLITEANVDREVMRKTITDGTLVGKGTKSSPLGILPLEKTGQFRPAFEFVDLTSGGTIPKYENVAIGDRIVTREYISDYGYLYNFNSMRLINSQLSGGWRIPTKEDWDNMLNAIEPCDKYRNHDLTVANRTLGKYAGKLLKSTVSWDNPIYDEMDDYASMSGKCCNDVEHPQEKIVDPSGSDKYGMGMMPSGYYDGADVMEYFSKRGYYWTNSQISETDVYVKRFDYDRSGVVQTVESPRSYFSIRLVKDYDGNNYHSSEVINAETYETILMPSLNTEYGFSIWTSTNLALGEKRYHPITPNNGECISNEAVYFMNEWNGCDWDKKKMSEGDTIVLLEGLSGETTSEYMIVDGVLTNVQQRLRDGIREELQDEIERIESIIGSGFTDDSGNTVSITEKVTEISTLFDEALESLDERIDETNENLAELSGLTRTMVESIGLNEDGTYTPSEESRYIGSAVTIAEAIEVLDYVASSQEEEINAFSGAIESIGEGLAELSASTINPNGNHTYNCSNPDEETYGSMGALTLYTNDGTPIIIKLDSDYGDLSLNDAWTSDAVEGKDEGSDDNKDSIASMFNDASGF